MMSQKMCDYDLRLKDRENVQLHLNSRCLHFLDLAFPSIKQYHIIVAGVRCHQTLAPAQPGLGTVGQKCEYGIDRSIQGIDCPKKLAVPSANSV